jgi:hypothetical protein
VARHNSDVRAASILLILLLTAAPVLAQAPPALVIDAPPELSAARARLESYDRSQLAGIVGLVGLSDPGPPIRVVLATDDGELARQVTPWTAGFAVGEASLIVLFPSRSPRYPHDTLEDVLRHEVAHILISRAANSRPVPRWFHEGLAMAVERPWGLEDRSRLASTLLFGPRLTLGGIDALFTGGQGMQARGYSLSAAVVRHIISEHGAAAPAGILRRVADGWGFDQAAASVTGRSIPYFESEFWNRQRTWTMWIPLLASSTVLWLGVIGLAALAVRRRRQRAAAMRKRWDAEEAVVLEQESRSTEP